MTETESLEGEGLTLRRESCELEGIMAAGPTLLGLGCYTAVKVAGYSLAARCLNSRAEEKPRAGAWVIGVVRTLIGMWFGAAVLFGLSFYVLGRNNWAFFALLVPIRLAEWLLLFEVFYRKAGWSRARRLRLACAGLAWSFLLDVPAVVAGSMIPGGFWIC